MCIFDDDENFGIFGYPIFRRTLWRLLQYVVVAQAQPKYLPFQVVQLIAIPNLGWKNSTRFKVTRTCKRFYFSVGYQRLTMIAIEIDQTRLKW